MAWGVWSGPEVTLKGRGEEEEEEEMEGVGDGQGGEGFPLFSSPQLLYEGRNIIFSTRALPRRDPRAELRRLKCQSP